MDEEIEVNDLTKRYNIYFGKSVSVRGFGMLKEIKANFIITNKNENIVFYVNDTINSPTTQLTITTNDFSGITKITWPEGIAPDSTNPMFSDVNTGYNGGNKQITLLANSEITIQFFKENSSIKYSNSDFQVEGEI